MLVSARPSVAEAAVLLMLTLYRRFIDQSDRMSLRYHSHRHLTVTHGDAHIWNFLLPRAGVSDTVRIFDFDLWDINVPTHDLAYMVALHWYPERRQGRRELWIGVRP